MRRLTLIVAGHLTGLPANGGFYFQAFDGSVTLPVAGYDYNSVWTPLLAGLPPAGVAAGGSVCISGATYDQVRKVLPVTFVDLGVQQVKNIEEPIRA